jgi:hypothetical protein
MRQTTAIVVLLLSLLIGYFVISGNNESFTAISGTQKQMVTYDDYGTFNFLHHFNDMGENYDPTYHNISCHTKIKDTLNTNKQIPKINYPYPVDEDFLTDGFIEYDGQKVRRSLIPGNYTDHSEFADADFDRNQLHLAVRINRSKNSDIAPWPHNVYFNKIPRNQ